MSSLNYKLPGYEVGISNIDSPKNRFVVLKYLKIYFPTGKKVNIFSCKENRVISTVSWKSSHGSM